MVTSAKSQRGAPRRAAPEGGEEGEKRIIKKKGSRGRAAIGCGAHSLPGSQRLKFILAIKNIFCTIENKASPCAGSARLRAAVICGRCAGFARGVRLLALFFFFFFK